MHAKMHAIHVIVICFCILQVQTNFIKQIRSGNTLFIIRIDSHEIIPCLFVELFHVYNFFLLWTFYFFIHHIYTLKLNYGSLIAFVLDVSADTACWFHHGRAIFDAYDELTRAHHTIQALRDNSLVTRSEPSNF